MNDLIEFLTHFHKNAPPFISENEDGSYSLMGKSDLTTGRAFDYGELGQCKLTAKNHSETLSRLMEFIVLVDELDDKDMLDLEDEEVVEALEYYFSLVLTAYFGKTGACSYEHALKVLSDNPQLVNEALYNLTKDKEQLKEVDYQSMINGLEGHQFEDPYINIAYEIAKDFNLRPFDVIEKWTTSELIVTFAKLANDHSLDSFLNWFYNQPNAKKPPIPKKQAFYFEEIEDKEDG